MVLTTKVAEPLLFLRCGKRGIRTPGPVKVSGFQDRRIRPLCHLSVCKDTKIFVTTKKNFLIALKNVSLYEINLPIL